jgi:hypothetical protein
MKYSKSTIAIWITSISGLLFLISHTALYIYRLEVYALPITIRNKILYTYCGLFFISLFISLFSGMSIKAFRANERFTYRELYRRTFHPNCQFFPKETYTTEYGSHAKVITTYKYSLPHNSPSCLDKDKSKKYRIKQDSSKTCGFFQSHYDAQRDSLVAFLTSENKLIQKEAV